MVCFVATNVRATRNALSMNFVRSHCLLIPQRTWACDVRERNAFFTFRCTHFKDTQWKSLDEWKMPSVMQMRTHDHPYHWVVLEPMLLLGRCQEKFEQNGLVDEIL